MLMLLGNKARHCGMFWIEPHEGGPTSLFIQKIHINGCNDIFPFVPLFFLPSGQADAAHERVVKREDGERLAKVIFKVFLLFLLN